MIKNILLPGGIGYIGSHVTVDLLLKTSYNLTIVDNYLNSTNESLERIFETLSAELGTSAELETYKSRVRFYEGNS